MFTPNTYFSPGEREWTELGGGLRRKIVAHTPQLMAVLVHFEKGAIGTPHFHEVHDQIAVVQAGSFECEVAGAKRVLRTGDAYLAVHGQMHGVVALEDGSVLLDMFSPCREDYL